MRDFFKESPEDRKHLEIKNSRNKKLKRLEKQSEEFSRK